MTKRMLVAGFGNVLRGDDGFGVEVVRRLQDAGPPPGTVCLEIGTGGVALAQELMTPCDRLVIVDAMTRGGTPGDRYVLRVEGVGAARSIDMHMTVPARVLELATSMGTLPREVFMVGCEPAVVDDLTLVLSDVVEDAVEPALRDVLALLARSNDE
ncbi:MAG: hydrogenase maturation protease [Vicinamibacterales bacterium]